MNRRIPISILAALIAALAGAQEPPSLDAWLSEAVEGHPRVQASRHRHRGALDAAEAAGAPANPELEIAPGVGFTNSNFLLAQPLDVSGVRAARARQARAEANAAAAALRHVRASVARELLESLAAAHAADRAVDNARRGEAIARATVEAVRRRLEIGEAPALQLVRAEIDWNRAGQAVLLAEADRAGSRAALASALGRPAEGTLPVLAWGVADAAGAETRRPETTEARALVAAAEAALLEARRRGGPEVFAGVASDVWSLQRPPSQGERFGVQILLRMPLFDRGANRNAARAAEAALRAREADLADAVRRVALEVETARVALDAAERVAANYGTDLLPRAERMLEAMQSGFEAGLTGFLDVLEAQRSLEALRAETSDARLRLDLAHARFLSAAFRLPGLETPRP